MPTDPLGLAPGAILAGRYRIDAALGRGGMGVVFRAHDRVLDEAVAVKVLRPEVASDVLRRRFRAEIKLARKIRHPNVCAIHEYGEEAGLAYIAMELVEGEDLRQLLQRRGRLSAREAASLGRQIAAGLAAIHEAGIVHRDLKPPNAMVDAGGRLRLMDFGIAKQLDDGAAQHTAVGQVLGTPEYMSPEQASGKPVDARSDLYALGVLLFELLTGRVPFRGNTPVGTLMQQVTQAVPIGDLRDVPDELRELVARLLAKSPDDRPASAVAVAAELARLDQGLDEAADAGLTMRQPVPDLDSTARQPVAALESTTRQPAPRLEPTTRQSSPEWEPTVKQPLPGLEPTMKHRAWDDLELAPSVPLDEPAAPMLPAPSQPVGRRLVLPLAVIGCTVLVGAAGLLALRSTRPAPVPQATTLPALEPVPIVVDETPLPVAATPAPATPAPASRPSAKPAAVAAAVPAESRPRAEARPRPSSTPAAQPAPAAPAADDGPGFGILRIEVEPAAEISIDGKPVGLHAKHDALLEQGSHTVTLRFPGRPPYERKVELRAGESVRLGLRMDAAAP